MSGVLATVIVNNCVVAEYETVTASVVVRLVAHQPVTLFLYESVSPVTQAEIFKISIIPWPPSLDVAVLNEAIESPS